MENFWDSNAWGTLVLIAIILVALLLANILKRSFKFFHRTLIPTSVLAGLLIVIVECVFRGITGEVMFDSAFFNGNGTSILELITYHALAIGFIATTFKSINTTISKRRVGEIINTGITTVSTYLLQGALGIGITVIAGLFVSGFFTGAGALLPYAFGQGSGQAMNFGNIFESDYGFVGGKSFGLTLAALGFIAASVGGVIHLNILKHRGQFNEFNDEEGAHFSGSVESENEIPMEQSIDKMTIQLAFIALAYFLAFITMMLLGKLAPGSKSIIFGFNFIFGVLFAFLIRLLLRKLMQKNIVKKTYINNFLMTRASNFFFDIMVVAGIAAIRLGVLKNYWGIILILAAFGTAFTYWYNRFVVKRLFKEYKEEQFLAMYGMLTGTACTGIILLRELDKEFKTPASDNLVFQNIPAIILGFPMMFIGLLAPTHPIMAMSILAGYFVVLNLILFRKQIFKKQ